MTLRELCPKIHEMILSPDNRYGIKLVHPRYDTIYHAFRSLEFSTHIVERVRALEHSDEDGWEVQFMDVDDLALMNDRILDVLARLEFEASNGDEEENS